MRPDELEFSISQYLDGTLPPLEAARVEELLATDVDARAIFAEYQHLNDSLRALPKAQVDFDALAMGISNSLAGEEAPIRHYRIGFRSVLGISAIAATLFVVIGTAFMLLKAGRSEVNQPEVTLAKVDPPTIEISGPTIQLAAAPVIVIGPPVNGVDTSWHSHEAVVSGPTRVIIASGTPAGQDSSDQPY